MKTVRPRPLALLILVSTVAIANAPPDATVSKDVASYLSATDLPQCITQIKSWEGRPLEERIKLMDELTRHLESLKLIPLSNLGDVTISTRLHESEFYGHGLLLQQDIFVEGGKAAWAIEILLRAHVPSIIESLPAADLKWNASLIREAVRAYKNGIEDGRKDSGAKKDPPSERDAGELKSFEDH